VDTSETVGLLRVVARLVRDVAPEAIDIYLVSMAAGASDVLEVQWLARQAGIDEAALDIAPWIETIDDLRHADGIIRRLLQIQPTPRTSAPAGNASRFRSAPQPLRRFAELPPGRPSSRNAARRTGRRRGARTDRRVAEHRRDRRGVEEHRMSAIDPRPERRQRRKDGTPRLDRRRPVAASPGVVGRERDRDSARLAPIGTPCVA
jgi:Phosphoenolpyruvate carboxylase